MSSDFPSAKVIAHSKAPNGEELITLEVELHRFILPEFNTHRVFSRNFQSSRAVPVQKMIDQVREDPAMPVHWGENQRGMVADQECNNHILDTYGDEFSVQDWWRLSAQEAANSAEAMDVAGYHKQITNRLLEPFMKTKGVVTSTKEGFESFFKLRCHKDAQPEIKALADKMYEAIEESVAENLNYGEYHLPYVQWWRNILEDGTTEQLIHKASSNLDLYTVEDAIKVSSSCCAQVSYRVLDDSLDKAKKIYDMLNLPEKGNYKEDPPHFSPTEHIAKVVEDVQHDDWMTGNFVTGCFWQYRKALEVGKEDKFLS